MVEQQPLEEKHEYKRSYHVGHARGSGYLLGANIAINIRDTSDFWFHNGADVSSIVVSMCTI